MVQAADSLSLPRDQRGALPGIRPRGPVQRRRRPREIPAHIRSHPRVTRENARTPDAGSRVCQAGGGRAGSARGNGPGNVDTTAPPPRLAHRRHRGPNRASPVVSSSGSPTLPPSRRLRGQRRTYTLAAGHGRSRHDCRRQWTQGSGCCTAGGHSLEPAPAAPLPRRRERRRLSRGLLDRMASRWRASSRARPVRNGAGA